MEDLKMLSENNSGEYSANDLTQIHNMADIFNDNENTIKCEI